MTIIIIIWYIIIFISRTTVAKKIKIKWNFISPFSWFLLRNLLMKCLCFFWRENFSVFFCLISSIYTKHKQQQQQFRPNCFIFYFVYSYKQNINIMFIIIIGWLVNYVSCIVFVMFVLLLEIGYNIYISCQFDIKKCARKIALFSVFFLF